MTFIALEHDRQTTDGLTSLGYDLRTSTVLDVNVDDTGIGEITEPTFVRENIWGSHDVRSIT